MDPSEALSLPGVKAYVSSDDVPGDNKTGYHVLDEEIFATDKVVIFFFLKRSSRWEVVFLEAGGLFILGQHITHQNIWTVQAGIDDNYFGIG